jgi:hypothetical protein
MLRLLHILALLLLLHWLGVLLLGCLMRLRVDIRLVEFLHWHGLSVAGGVLGWGLGDVACVGGNILLVTVDVDEEDDCDGDPGYATSQSVLSLHSLCHCVHLQFNGSEDGACCKSTVEPVVREVIPLVQIPLCIVETVVVIVIGVVGVVARPQLCKVGHESKVNDPEEEHPEMEGEGDVHVVEFVEEELRNQEVNAYSHRTEALVVLMTRVEGWKCDLQRRAKKSKHCMVSNELHTRSIQG